MVTQTAADVKAEGWTRGHNKTPGMPGRAGRPTGSSGSSGASRAQPWVLPPQQDAAPPARPSPSH
eukprot:3623052-Alexandrium_andersonii.AAC.1